MPGMAIQMSLYDALATVAAMAMDTDFPPSASDEQREALYAEAMRIIERHAAEVAQRNLPTPDNVEPLKERSA